VTVNLKEHDGKKLTWRIYRKMENDL